MPALDNPRRERFCQEYVVDGNATQAYIRAGYSEKGAAQSAAALLRNPKISSRIAELKAKVLERLEITQESVLREIEDTRANAAACEQHATALKASELKGKHIGMWPNKLEANVNIVDALNADELRALRAALEALPRDEGQDADGDRPTTH